MFTAETEGFGCAFEGEEFGTVIDEIRDVGLCEIEEAKRFGPEAIGEVHFGE